MDRNLIDREVLKEKLTPIKLYDGVYCKAITEKDIDDAQTVEAYPFEQVQELVKLNQQFAQEIENLKRPQGEWIPVSERLPEEKLLNPTGSDFGFDFEEVLCTTIWGSC